jgi:hypothetical protein
MTKNNVAATLTFDLSEDQVRMLETAGEQRDIPANSDGLEYSYRAWNASFVPCSEPYSTIE